MAIDLSRRAKRYIKGNPALYKLALKAYSLKHPPPYRQPNMEFHFDAWNAISSLHYRGGRQIGEDNSGPYPYKEIATTEYEWCRFADSRFGLMMNVSNLRSVMPYAADAYRLITILRNKYIAQRKIASPRFDLINAYLFSKFAVSLPSYMTRRRDHPVNDGDLPQLETAFYMLGTAPYMLVRQLMVRGDATPVERKPWNAQELYELCDRSRVLISTRNQGCPAAPKLIRDFIDVIMNGTYSDDLESPETARVLSVLGPWDRFYAYALASSRIELLIKIAQAIVARGLIDMESARQRRGDPPDPALLAVRALALSRSYVHASETRDTSSVLETIVAVVTELLIDHDEQAVVAEVLGMHEHSGQGAQDSPPQLRGACASRSLRYCPRAREILVPFSRPWVGPIGQPSMRTPCSLESPARNCAVCCRRSNSRAARPKPAARSRTPPGRWSSPRAAV